MVIVIKIQQYAKIYRRVFFNNCQRPWEKCRYARIFFMELPVMQTSAASNAEPNTDCQESFVKAALPYGLAKFGA
jgi:hypothetical protein